MSVSQIYYGEIEAMIAEVGALDMGAEWFTMYGYTHAVLPHGDEQYDTTYCTSLEDAREVAKEMADHYLVKASCV